MRSVTMLPSIAAGYILMALTIASCVVTPEIGYKMKYGGSNTAPFELDITLPDRNCPTVKVEPSLKLGAACDPNHLGGICVKRGQWLRWTVTGGKIASIDFINNPSPLELCKPGLPASKYKCKIQRVARPGVYEYKVTLENCPDIDPKIIITD